MIFDLRDAWRALWRSPSTTLAAALILALGVGANTAILSVFESVVLNPLPYPNAQRLVSVTLSGPTGPLGLSPWLANEWKTRGAGVDAVGFYTDGQWVLTGDGEAEVFRGQRVNADFFEALGVRARLGRLLQPEDDRPPRANVVVLGFDLWTRRFGASPDVVGRTVTLNGASFRIVGVLDAAFQPLRMSNPAEVPQVFAPLGYDPVAAAACHTCNTFATIARLAPGMTVDAAPASLDTVMRALSREYPAEFTSEARVQVSPLKDAMTASLRLALWIALGAAACVLLVACANVASLQLARATARAGEFAVRGALGGSRTRMARTVLFEGALIGTAGCIAGLLLGRASVRVLTLLAPRELPRLGEIGLDARVVIVACAAGLLTSIASAVAPAVMAAGADLNDALKHTATRTVGGRAARIRGGLIVVEIAVAFVLITATGLLVRTVDHLLSVDAGFDAAHVLTMTPVGGGVREASAEAALQARRRMLGAIRSLPGVTAAALVNELPLARPTPIDCIIEGVAADAAHVAKPNVLWVDGDYFAALHIPLRRGRLLTDRDGPKAPAALVSESFARQRFPGADAIGRRIRIDVPPNARTWMTIVGVVGDVRNAGLDRAPDEAVYQPLAMNPFHYIRLVARTSGDPWTLDRPMRQAIRRVDPLTAVFHVQPMGDYVTSSMAQRRFALALMTAFGGLTLVLSVVGLYSVLAYSVSRRTPELGVRAALGATPRRLLTLVLSHGVALTAAGIAAGAAIGVATTRLLGTLLYGVGSGDILTFAWAALVIAVASVAATGIPARRASQIDPLSAMRQSG